MFPEKNLLKVLLVEDEPGILATMKELLIISGFPRVTTAATGTEAERQITRNNFDLLITDLELPGTGGEDLLRLSRKNNPRSQVIVASGVLSEGLMERLILLGARACLKKPFLLKPLVSEVEGVFHGLADEELLKKEEMAILPLVSEYEKKDPFARGHSEKVADVSTDFALALDCSLNQLIKIRIASLGHDVGMSMVNHKILNKAGPLTTEEFKVIKQHPLHSGRMLDGILADRDAIDPIVKHHENFNGSGYPCGLSDEQVTFDAQILSLADAYAAMSADRPHRPALSEEDIRISLLDGRGERWSPEIVDAFVDTFLPIRAFT